MSERSRRAGKSYWRARERKLRAKYRGKIAVAVIVSLIVGMIGGIVVDKLVLTKHADTAITPVTTAAATSDTGDGGLAANLFGDPTDAVEPEITATETPVEETAEPVVTKSADEVFPEETTEAEDTAVSDVEWDNETEAAEPAPTLAIGTPDENSKETEAVEKEDTEETGDTFSSIIADMPQYDVTDEPTEVPAEEAAAAPAEETTEEPSEAATTDEPVETSSTEEPTEAPTQEPTPVPEETEVEVVPYGTAVTLTTDINADGTAHTEDDGSAFENVSLTLQVKKYLDFDYYDRTYGSKYNLKGGTAAVVLEMTLNGYTGTAPIIPQNFLLITFCDETGEVTTQGVQLIDAEIAGNTGVAITSDVPATIYKRYFKEDAGKEMTYMVVTTYNNGIKKEYRFEIIIPPEMITPEPTADPNMVGLSVGSRGDDVIKLQEALIEAGYLSGTADGIYGTGTAEAVKLMQKQFGLEETGDAGPLFLTYLYMDAE